MLNLEPHDELKDTNTVYEQVYHIPTSMFALGDNPNAVKNRGKSVLPAEPLLVFTTEAGPGPPAPQNRNECATGELVTLGSFDPRPHPAMNLHRPTNLEESCWGL